MHGETVKSSNILSNFSKMPSHSRVKWETNSRSVCQEIMGLS